jgi:precorrin-6B methylase 2
VTGSEPPVRTLGRLANGSRVSQALHVAATLGIPDLLRDGPLSADVLAERSGAHAPSLYRLLRALAAVGVFEEHDDRTFASNPLADALRSDADESLAGWAAFVGTPTYWDAWGELLHSIRTGENAFRHLHGVDVWEYRAARPEEGATFDRAMADLTRTANRALLDAYDFGRFNTLVDVGGGRGALLAGVLARHPDLRGVLFDQPHVVDTARETFAQAGVSDRVQVVGGSFFEGVPAGGDAYVLKWIVHDWEDEEAAAILRRCREALGDGGRVVVIERVLGQGDRAEAAFSDLNMLVMPGGRERTEDEFAALFAAAGLRQAAITPTAGALCLIDAEPV